MTGTTDMTIFKRYAVVVLMPALALAAMIAAAPAVAQTGAQTSGENGGDWSRWSVHDPQSRTRLNHDFWSYLLKYSVIPYTKTEKPGRKTIRELKLTGTRVGRPSAYKDKKKINYIPFEILNDRNQFGLVTAQYLRGLQDIEVSKLNRDDQLAYWLNFHNAGLVWGLVVNYPVRNLEEMIARDGPGRGFYHDKRFTVEGSALSLADIRDRIVLANWKEAVVIYGIYQGTLSGPNILTEAFDAGNVDELLKRNARDFVNSVRGARIRGNSVRYSRIYSWNPRLFGDQGTIVAHLREYAEGPTVARLARAERWTTLEYSWRLAEIRRIRTSLSGRAEHIHDLDRYRDIGLVGNKTGN